MAAILFFQMGTPLWGRLIAHLLNSPGRSLVRTLLIRHALFTAPPYWRQERPASRGWR